ncbi:MAG: hypothetical protein RLZZ568_1362 [Cyanobacteriota bacterium]|jgi:uncharacterized protein YecE (DUF72 family)
MFYLGCAVWAYEGWFGNFYPANLPKKESLKAYAQRLTAIEANTTFYAVPSEQTVQKWQVETPPDFRFCLKFPQTVSHQGSLSPQLPQAKSFLDRLLPLGPKLGAVFLQLPPSYGPEQLDDLLAFFDALKAYPLKLAVEVRHPQWWQPNRQATLHRELGDRQISQVILDTRPIYRCADDPQRQSKRRKPDLPVTFYQTASPLIVRFISHPQGQQNEPYLAEWQRFLTPLLQQNQEIYFFVHCPTEDYSPFTARRFYQQLRAANLVPQPLPWDQLRPLPQQLSLF